MSRREEIYQDLQSLSDAKYCEFHGTLVPGEEQLLGVRIPVLRQYAKELYTKYGKRADVLLQEIGDDCYESITLQALACRGISRGKRSLHRSKLSCRRSETGESAIPSAPA